MRPAGRRPITANASPARAYGYLAPSRPKYSIRPFYYTIICLTALALISLAAERYAQARGTLPGATLLRRDADLDPDEECRLVHQASDQCAFIRRHCPDDEPGFLAYLDLYYCGLAHVKPIAMIMLGTLLAILFTTIGIAASDFFCINLSTISTILGMSESMAGVTFLAFGNGSPDVFSTFAAMSTNSSSLAIGELVGAAGFITAVVAGSMALVRPFKVAKRSFIRDIGFFVVAASFSMGFLADGRLHLWECITMVAFYIFYVAVVVVWHWWITRRKRRRDRDAAARGHYHVPGVEELEVEEEYRDEDDEETSTRLPTSRGVSADDLSALEGGGPRTPGIEGPDDEDDDDEEARDKWLGELNSNMRLSRPAGRPRRSTMTPIRPSLVGALEFQAVLNSLQKSRNIQTIPMHSRRYSDDPLLTGLHWQDEHSSSTDPASRPTKDIPVPHSAAPVMETPGLGLARIGSNRARAVSANDVGQLKLDPKFYQNHVERPPSLLDISEDDDGSVKHSESVKSLPVESQATRPPSPSLNVSSPEDELAPLHPQHTRQRSQDHLAPPSDTLPAGFRKHYQPTVAPEFTESPAQSPRTRPQQHLPKIVIPRSPLSQGSSPVSPFPAYRDHSAGPHARPPSLQLPPSSYSYSSQVLSPCEEAPAEEKPIWWWPYRFLPSPGTLVSTLFPTLYGWRGKTVWEKVLGVISAVPVFLLTITLPVVEADNGDEESCDLVAEEGISAIPEDMTTARRKSIAAIMVGSPEMRASHPAESNTQPSALVVHGASGLGSTASVATGIEQRHQQNKSAEVRTFIPASGEAPSHPHAAPTAKPWNRWLTITQLYMAPLFIVFILYAQYLSPTNLLLNIIRGVLISLLASTLLLIPLLLSTTPTHRPPAYRIFLSLAGFVVSIAWISTIASQVVALLKTFAIILNMSQAILGLTVFAVGNSLGDLVADITVARLGYPIMALSACFGGPMLNILLGIGLSGTWILVSGAEQRHRKHPGKEIHFRTYEIEVGDTLVVSGVTLLVTLVGLLVAVPLNRWMMTRRIAWALIALWCVGTVVNVVLEIVGGVGRGRGAGELAAH